MAENNWWEGGQGYPLGPINNPYLNEEVVDETVTGVNYPNLGQPLYPQATQPRVPDWISSPNRPAIPERTGIMRNIWQGTKDLASNISPVGIINALTRRQGADQSFGGYPGSGFGSRAGLFPQEVANLERLSDRGLLYGGGKDFTGTNVVSQFGDYNKHIAERKGLFDAKLQDKEYMARTFGNVKGIDLNSIKTLEDMEKAYRIKYGKNAAIANRLNLYANFGGATNVSAADKITAPIGTDRVGGDPITPRGPVTTGGGGTFNPVFDQRGRRDPGPEPYGAPTWHGATKARGQTFERTGGKQGQVAGPGFGRGAYWAEGGRVGYQDGELVEDEYMAEATPGGMMEENIEEVQGEPTREQLEAIAFEIFRLPLEQLNEQQLEVVYQAAMEQEPSEEEVQFAAQEGPGEGIASLV